MSFTTDKQTLDDLNIFGKHGSDSVFTIFNKTTTVGGAGLLEQMFRQPLSDEDAINQRINAIHGFNKTAAAFPFQSSLFDSIELYLSNTDERSKLSLENNTLKRKLFNAIAEDTEYKTIYQGVIAVIQLLHSLRDFNKSTVQGHPEMNGQTELSNSLMADPELQPLFAENPLAKLPFEKVAEYDLLLRFRNRKLINEILQYVYLLDVLIAVAKVSQERGFIFPEALPAKEHILRMDGVYHPQVKGAIANTLHITPAKNIVFLTGANMAGKSTFMKTLGIAVYLAHMGFPVPAAKMEFSVLDGILTTINLADNLNMGVSHFYAEVLRIKKIAVELSQSKNLFIIFDELFRGTNVKDACEATIAITGALALKANCMFVVSTHIIEAGETLKEMRDNINFVYLPTKMQELKPVYTYKLAQGITADRHGMVIINNEGIIDIIKSRRLKASRI